MKTKAAQTDRDKTHTHTARPQEKDTQRESHTEKDRKGLRKGGDEWEWGEREKVSSQMQETWQWDSSGRARQ